MSQHGHAYRTALREGRCEVAEGIVQVLHRQPVTGHDAGNRISINGRTFEFSYYDATLAFNRTISNGGVLVQGARARVHYLDGTILKVEIAQEDWEDEARSSRESAINASLANAQAPCHTAYFTVAEPA